MSRGRGLGAGDQVPGLEGGPHPLAGRCRRRGPRAERGGGCGEHGEPHAVDLDPRAVDGQHRADTAEFPELAEVGLGKPAGHRGDHVWHHEVRRGRAGQARARGRGARRLSRGGRRRGVSRHHPAAAPPRRRCRPPFPPAPARPALRAAWATDEAACAPPAALWPPLSTATVTATAPQTATSPPAAVGSDWRRINGSLTVTQPYRNGSATSRPDDHGPRFLLLSRLRARGEATHLTVIAGTPPGTATLRL